MKSKKEKRSIKSLNEQTVRKKLVSPKLDIFKPAHTSTEKKYLPLENKMKN